MRIIPAIDIIDGKCVRLTQGDFDQQTIYNDNPVDMAKQFEDAGLRYLHVVDLDGARERRVINWRVLESITKQTNLQVDFGGGVRTDQDVKTVLENGAAQVTGGSVAAKEPAVFLRWLEQYGNEKVVLGADSKNAMIAVSGWQETSDLELNAYVGAYVRRGIRYCIATDVSKDGMLGGPALDMYQSLLSDYPGLKLVASGGVSCLQDLAALRDLGVDGVIVGKAIYENKITLAELASFE